MKVRTICRLPLLLVLCAGLLGGGCSGLRIHRPQDLAKAEEAKKQLEEADLTGTIAAERERLNEVLTRDLELARQHTLARRDARLIYIIGEGDSQAAWDYLEADIDERITELDFDPDSFQEALKALGRLPNKRDDLRKSQSIWLVNQSRWPDLPDLSCPLPEDLDESFVESDNLKKLAATPEEAQAAEIQVPVDFKQYKRHCNAFLREANKVPSKNRAAIQKLRDAKTAAVAEAERVVAELDKAQEEYAAAVEAKAPDLKDKRDTLLEKFRKLGGLGDQLSGIAEAEPALESNNLGGVLEDLKATARKARLEAEKGDVLDALSTGLESPAAQQWLSPLIQGEGAQKPIEALTGISATLDATAPPNPVTSLLVRQGQLDLDIAKAEKQEAFFDEVVALLEEQDKAFEVELVHLGKAKRLLNYLRSEDSGCLSGGEKPDDPKTLGNAALLATGPHEECRELVFRLLVAYSSSWALGRVEQQQIDEKIIGLHQQAALDSSEIAFSKWQSLFSLPTQQLVDLHATGLHVDQLLEFLDLLGLGWIAAGVN